MLKNTLKGMKYLMSLRNINSRKSIPVMSGMGFNFFKKIQYL